MQDRDIRIDGNRIRLFREAIGLTQDELAARVKPKPVTRQAVVNWEKGIGIKTFRMVKKIACALGIRTSLLAAALLNTEDKADDIEGEKNSPPVQY